MELHPLEWNLLAVTVAAVGACIGSYLNVCIYRWPLGMSTNQPSRSLCFSCERTLEWRDNIPVFGWFLLRGRCRYCGARFSVRYAVVEALTAALFLHVFWVFGLTHATLLYLVWVALQIVGSMIDFDHTIIPDRITLGGTALVLAWIISLNVVVGREHGLLLATWPEAVFGAVFAAGFTWLVRQLGTWAFGRQAMGLGDVKLMAMNGAILGWWRGLLVVMGLGPIIALTTILVLRLLSRFKVERYTEIPFGPYLCLGSYAALFWGSDLVEWWLALPPGFSSRLDRPWEWFGW